MDSHCLSTTACLSHPKITWQFFLVAGLAVERVTTLGNVLLITQLPEVLYNALITA